MVTNPELYRNAKTLPVKGHTHDAIQGISVPSKHIPFRVGHIDYFSHVANEFDSKAVESSKLRQISPAHGRSFEVIYNKQDSVIFSDEYGNIFSTLTTKGNNLSFVRVKTSAINPSGFEFYGLQESNSMVRALKASELLRANGIPTELIIKVIEPSELPWKEEMLPLDQFKTNLLEYVWQRNAKNGNYDRLATRRHIPLLAQSLSELTFFISVRGMQVSERVADFGKTISKEDIESMLAKAYRYINFDEKMREKKDPSNIADHFEIGNDEDAVRYFLGYLPDRAATNVARMHKLGLSHSYLHPGNISTVGSIVDLDSVKGEPVGLGDKAITEEDMISDVYQFIHGHADWVLPSKLIGLIVEDGEQVFKYSFIEKYIEEMGWGGDITKFKHITNLYNKLNFQDAFQNELLKVHMDEIVKNYNIAYESSISADEVIDFIYKKLPIQGGEMGDVPGATSELHKQTILIGANASLFITRELSEYLESHQGLENIDPESLEEFKNNYGMYLIYVLNKELASVDFLNLERDPQKGKFETKNEGMKKLERRFLRWLMVHWGWENDIEKYLPQIQKLYEDHGIVFDDELATFYQDEHKRRQVANSSKSYYKQKRLIISNSLQKRKKQK